MRQAFTFAAILAAVSVGILQAEDKEPLPAKSKTASTPATTPSPNNAIDFLNDVPELRGVSLNMSEKAFRDLIAHRKLPCKRAVGNGQTTYEVRVPGKKSDAIVIFGFQNASCTGIQRMPANLRK